MFILGIVVYCQSLVFHVVEDLAMVFLAPAILVGGGYIVFGFIEGLINKWSDASVVVSILFIIVGYQVFIPTRDNYGLIVLPMFLAVAAAIVGAFLLVAFFKRKSVQKSLQLASGTSSRD